ncbi:MAG: ATP-binding protein [Prevotella sp.]|nr:ATP-binding protein [Prevotella sp.]
MNTIKKVFDNIAQAAEQAAATGTPTHREADGLLHCDICGEKKQTVVEILGEKRTVRCICKCEQEAKELKEKAIKDRERLRKIEKMRIKGFEQAEMQGWTFENDDGKQPKVTEAAKAYCKNFEHFRAEGKGLVFYGKVGTGKTYAAACIANELISQGVPVLMTNFARIINRIQSSFEGRQEYIDSLNDFDLIIIDDLAAERNTEFVNEIVYTVIDARYRAKKPLIVTTNLGLDKMMNETEINRQRIYSRVLQLCHPLEVKGDDRRVQAAFDDFAEMQRLLGM